MSQNCFGIQSQKGRVLVCFQRAAGDEICGETVLSVKMGETI